MLSTPQAKYFTHWLTPSLPSDNLGKWTASLQDTQVDLTPHQIDTALFAFKWAEEVKLGLGKELRDLDPEIKLRNSESKKTSRLDEKVRLQRLIKDIEKRLNLYQAQDDVDSRKETLLSKVEAMLAQKIEQTKLVTFHWRIV